MIQSVNLAHLAQTGSAPYTFFHTVNSIASLAFSNHVVERKETRFTLLSIYLQTSTRRTAIVQVLPTMCLHQVKILLNITLKARGLQNVIFTGRKTVSTGTSMLLTWSRGEYCNTAWFFCRACDLCFSDASALQK